MFTATLPKATLVALTLSVGTAAFNCRAKVSETPAALAVRVAVCATATDDAVAVNVALVALAGTVTVAGTVTAVLLLARLTTRPPLAAAPFRVTVQVSVPDPVMEELLQESALNAAVPDGAAVPVPLSPITAVALVEELLVMVS